MNSEATLPGSTSEACDAAAASPDARQLGTRTSGTHGCGGAAFRPAFTRFWPSRTLKRICVQSRVVCLTYDDGPGPDLTRAVLAVLDEFNAKATFFAVGSRATGAPSVLDEVAAKGHEIACHTSRHLNAWKAGAQAAGDVRDGYEQLERWVKADGMFRPPYGKMSRATIAEIRRRRAPVGWWTIDGGDTHDDLPAVESAAAQLERDRGGVVLLHDFDRLAQKAERAAFVLKSTRLVLEAAQKMNLRPVRLSELLTKA